MFVTVSFVSVDCGSAVRDCGFYVCCMWPLRLPNVAVAFANLFAECVVAMIMMMMKLLLLLLLMMLIMMVLILI